MYIYIYYIYTRIYTYIHIITCCIYNLLLSEGRAPQTSRVGPPFNFLQPFPAADEAMRLQEELQARQLECDVRFPGRFLVTTTDVTSCGFGNFGVSSDLPKIQNISDWGWTLGVRPPNCSVSIAPIFSVSIPCDVNILAIFWGGVNILTDDLIFFAPNRQNICPTWPTCQH